MTEIYADLLSQTRQIKWLLAALLFLAFLFAVAVVSILRKLPIFHPDTKRALERGAFEKRIEDHIARGEYEKAKGLVKGEIIARPSDPLPQFYLGKCHYHLESFASSKACFLAVEKLDPSWRFRTKPWLESIEVILLEKRPASVD